MSKLEEVAALLRGDVEEEKQDVSEPEAVSADDEAAEPAAESASEQDKEPERFSVKGLAEKLELSPKQVYEQLAVNLGDKEYSLSQVKDLAKLGLKQEEREERRTSDYNKLMRERKEFDDVVRAVQASGVEIPQAFADEVKAVKAKRDAAEMSALARVLPEWEEASTRSKEIKQITELAATYGMGKQELDLLVTDHRLMKLLRDTAVALVKKQDVAPRSKPAPRTPTPIGNGRADKVSAIARLIS